MSTVFVNIVILLLYAIFVAFSIIQMVTMTNFFDNFSVAFDLVNEINAATSYSGVLQNTGFTLWRHYNGLARPLPLQILQETLDTQEAQIVGIENFISKISNLQGISLLDSKSDEIMETLSNYDCSQNCDQFPRQFCASIMNGVLTKGIYTPMSRLLEIYKNIPSLNYVPQIEWQSFFSRSVSGSLRTIRDTINILLGDIIDDKMIFVMVLGIVAITFYALVIFFNLLFGITYVYKRFLNA